MPAGQTGVEKQFLKFKRMVAHPSKEISKGESLVYSCTDYLNTIVPNVPTTLLLGPAVKNKVFLGPLAGSPPPKSIAQSWSMWITAPDVFFTVPTKAPVWALNAL